MRCNYSYPINPFLIYKSIELGLPLLDFINFDFYQYDLLRHKIRLFIQKNEEIFNSGEIETEEISETMNNFFPDLEIHDIDGGNTEWWKASLIYGLYLQYDCFYSFCCLEEKCLGDKDEFDYLYLPNEIIDKVKKILEIDNSNLIINFSPLCRINHYYRETFCFAEKVLISPSSFKKFTEAYDLFGIPFELLDENEDESKPYDFIDNDYVQKEPYRQEYIKKNLHVLKGYEFKSLQEAFICEIFKMAQLGIVLKRCENCDKYFVFNPNKPARYCNNKLPNVNMTCQQVAPQKKYNANLSPIQKAYTNALKNQNKKYHSKKSGLRTPDEDKVYEKWKQKKSEIKLEYQKKFDDAKTDTLKNNILQEFKNKLNS